MSCHAIHLTGKPFLLVDEDAVATVYGALHNSNLTLAESAKVKASLRVHSGAPRCANGRYRELIMRALWVAVVGVRNRSAQHPDFTSFHGTGARIMIAGLLSVPRVRYPSALLSPQGRIVVVQ